jgi:hypothetical protein
VVWAQSAAKLNDSDGFWPKLNQSGRTFAEGQAQHGDGCTTLVNGHCSAIVPF